MNNRLLLKYLPNNIINHIYSYLNHKIRINKLIAYKNRCKICDIKLFKKIKICQDCIFNSKNKIKCNYSL